MIKLYPRRKSCAGRCAFFGCISIGPCPSCRFGRQGFEQRAVVYQAMTFDSKFVNLTIYGSDDSDCSIFRVYNKLHKANGIRGCLESRHAKIHAELSLATPPDRRLVRPQMGACRRAGPQRTQRMGLFFAPPPAGRAIGIKITLTYISIRDLI